MDDDDLREGLRSLATAAPPQPPDRAADAIGRAGGIRRRRAVLAAAAVLVPVLAAGAVLRGPMRDEARPAGVPDAVDRSLVPLVEGLVEEWDRFNDLGPGEEVRWVYAGRLLEGTDVLLAAFETCAGDRCTRRIFGAMTEADLRAGKAWGYHRRAIDRGSAWAPYTAYDFHVRALNGRRFVVVLGGDAADRVTYAARILGARVTVSGELRQVADDVFVAPMPDDTHELSVRAYDGDDLVFSGGTDGSVDSELVDPPVVKDGYAIGPAVDGEVDAGAGEHRLYAGEAGFALLVRCGGAALRLTVNGAPYTAVCDDRPQVVVSALPEPVEGGYAVTVEADARAVYQMALARRS